MLVSVNEPGGFAAIVASIQISRVIFDASLVEHLDKLLAIRFAAMMLVFE
jgi:hypothetical protein